MAFDCFMKIEGMPGESTDSKYQSWQQLDSYSFGVVQPSSGSQSTGGARTVARASHQNFSVVKDMDKATPKLVDFCNKGNHIKEIKIEVCRQVGNEKQKYLEFTLSDVLVTSVTPLGSLGEGALPKESVSFDCGKFQMKYTELDHETGKPKGNVAAGWNRITNEYMG
jgi:type VI secretion system secreted protein Hcp